MKYFFLLLSCLFLFACKPQTSFDRINASNNYTPMYAPYSQYIKRQEIKINTTGELEKTEIKESDQFGRMVFEKSVGAKSSYFDSEAHYNYQTNKFTYYNQLIGVVIIDGDIIFDKQGRTIQLSGVDSYQLINNQTHFNAQLTFDNDKLVLFEMRSGIFFIENKVDWKNDFIIRSVYSYSQNGIVVLSSTTDYQYDEQGKLHRATTNYQFSDKAVSADIHFTDYNQHGDWTKALIYRYGQTQNEDAPSIMTREIEYF